MLKADRKWWGKQKENELQKKILNVADEPHNNMIPLRVDHLIIW